MKQAIKKAWKAFIAWMDSDPLTEAERQADQESAFYS